MKEHILNYRNFIPTHLSNKASVWCFQSSRLIAPFQILVIDKSMTDFVNSWQSHGKPVVSFYKIFFGQFFVFVAENTSGCSIDKLFDFIKKQSNAYQLALLDRCLQAFFVKNKIEIIPLSQVAYAFEHKILNDNTLYFDNSISTLKELKHSWILPIGDSWLKESL